MSVVREEFGPTLPDLLGSRFGVPARKIWIGLAVLAVVAVAIAAWVTMRPKPGQTPVIVRKPVAFNLIHTAGLHRVTPRSGEELRLESRSGPLQSFAVRPLRIGSYKGDVSAELTLMSARMIDEMGSQYRGFLWRGDGRVNINRQPGYQILFQTEINGRTVYGKRVLIVVGPDPPPHLGADITILAARSTAVPHVDAVATNGALKTPYRSFRFGTQRP
jgi:hypothetical protein